MTSRATTSRRSATALASAALFLAALVAVVYVASASGKAADVLSDFSRSAPPSCPTPSNAAGGDPKQCFVFARVTGFQVASNGKRAVFKVPSDGHLVAWSPDLSAPSATEQAAFTEDQKLGEASARISVLKPKEKGQFKLTKQSPKVLLADDFGRKPIYTLTKPLKVKRGNVIALTTNSWVPNLAHDGDLTADGDLWRASRSTQKCGDDPNKSAEENTADLKASTPQRKVGTTRKYGCSYGPTRILYQAYYVPDK